MSYLFLKDAHSILRWLVILTAIWALVRFWSGYLTKSEYTRQDRSAGLLFTTVLNVQFLLGIVLYATSPITKGAMANMAAAMKEPTLRFFAVEHPTAMILSVIIAQVGFSMAKRAPDDQAKFRRGTIAYTIAAVLIVLSIPWPFLPYGRPLFPVLGQ